MHYFIKFSLKKETKYIEQTTKITESDSSIITKKGAPYKKFIMDGGTFDVDILVVISEDLDRVVDSVNSFLSDSTLSKRDFIARGVTYHSNDGRIILWMPSMSYGDVNDVATANHELFHVVKAIMFWANISLSNDTEETYAYEMAYISRQFYNHFK